MGSLGMALQHYPLIMPTKQLGHLVVKIMKKLDEGSFDPSNQYASFCREKQHADWALCLE